MQAAHKMSEEEKRPRQNSDLFTKIEDLTKEGHDHLQNGEVVDSYLAYEKAVELAKETQEPFTVRACFFNLGACCVAKGEASKGVEYLMRALPPDKESDGPLNFADLHYNLAVAYDVLGRASEAKRCYETSLKGYKNCSNLEMQGEVLLKLGGALTSLNLLEAAADVFEQGETIFKELEDERHEIHCLSSRATLLAEMRNIQCEELLKIVVDRVESLQDDLLKAKVYSDAGVVYTSTGHYTNAAEYLNRSLKIIQSTEGDQKLQASVCQNLGAVYNQVGAYVKAVIFHEKAVELYGLLGKRYAQGHVFSNLGFAFGQLGELEKSREHFIHALQAAKDCQDYRGQLQANEGLSAVCFQQEDYEKAVSYLKAALTVSTVGGVADTNVHERIVAKLSNALEYQLRGNKPTEIQPKSAVLREKKIVPLSVDGSSSKVGQTRPREKNHKFVARGLDLGEHLSDAEDSSDSTFSSISSYSGSTLSFAQEESPKQEDPVVNRDKPESSTPVKKDPFNHTYEEPQDMIRALESGALRLSDLPRGPRDHILASMNASTSQKFEKTQTDQRENSSTKSRTCVVQ